MSASVAPEYESIAQSVIVEVMKGDSTEVQAQFAKSLKETTKELSPPQIEHFVRCFQESRKTTDTDVMTIVCRFAVAVFKEHEKLLDAVDAEKESASKSCYFG
jgi:hypothetical protein